MIVIGVILLIVGLVLAIPLVWSVGLLLLVVGLVFELLGASGRPVGGRRHYY